MKNTSRTKKSSGPVRVYTPLELDGLRNAKEATALLRRITSWVEANAVDEGVLIATLLRDLGELDAKYRELAAKVRNHLVRLDTHRRRGEGA